MPSRPGIEELLERAATGDASAVTSLFDRYRVRLRRMVGVRLDARLTARIDPSDIVQEALMEAHRQLPSYLQMRPVAFYPWLKQIASNRLIDMYRRHMLARHRTVRKEAAFPCADEPATNQRVDGLDSREHAAARLIIHELRDRVPQAVAELPSDLREVLLLRLVELKSVTEIAGQMNVAEGTVRSRQFRALAQLRRLLADG